MGAVRNIVLWDFSCHSCHALGQHGRFGQPKTQISIELRYMPKSATKSYLSPPQVQIDLLIQIEIPNQCLTG